MNKCGGTRQMKETKRKGFKSLTGMLITIIFVMITIPAVVLASLGIYYLNRSMTESAENYRDAMLDGYRTEIRSQVQGALAVVQEFYDKSQRGELTEAEAKQRAADAVRAMRYRDDSSGYLWIDGADYVLVAHPILTDQEGTNRYELTDQNEIGRAHV